MLKSFEQDGFDILFSDIELEENETGLTFCGRLRELGYSGEIIFSYSFSGVCLSWLRCEGTSLSVKTNHTGKLIGMHGQIFYNPCR